MPERMMEAMERFDPDLVLMDLHMPGSSGTALTAQIREHPRFEHTPVVFLTGDQDPERQVEVLEHGGDDYPDQAGAPAPPDRRGAEPGQARPRAGQQPHGQDGQRPPSGHRPVHPPGPDEGAGRRSWPSTHAGGALLVEMGNAAALRKHYGYAAFENLINDAGRYLGSLAQDHITARLSDNAFLVVVRGLERGALDAYARSLRDGVGYHDFQTDGDTLRLRCTIGYTSFEHGFTDAGAVLSACEDARARSPGLVRSAWPPTCHRIPRSSSDVADELRAALASGDDTLYLAFQPVVAVAGGDDAQFQVLVRMRGPDGNVRRAGEFLSAAQSAGLMPQVDRWVMEQALALLQKRRAESRPMRLFVSQSPQHAGAGQLRRLAAAGARAPQRRSVLAGDRPAPGRRAGARGAAAPVLRAAGAGRGAVLPQPVPSRRGCRPAAAATAAGLPAPVRAISPASRCRRSCTTRCAR